MADEAHRQSRWDSFQAAHGFVRDGLAALVNLENLLKSPRIGPKALEKVVAELRPGSRPLGDAVIMLIDLVDARAPSGVSDALREFTRERIERLDAAIQQAAGSDMGAKARLRLEAQVVQLGGELNALRDLVELLDAATTLLPTELDLNALTMEALGKLAPSTPKHPRLAKIAYEGGARGDDGGDGSACDHAVVGSLAGAGCQREGQGDSVVGDGGRERRGAVEPVEPMRTVTRRPFPVSFRA